MRKGKPFGSPSAAMKALKLVPFLSTPSDWQPLGAPPTQQSACQGHRGELGDGELGDGGLGDGGANQPVLQEFG